MASKVKVGKDISKTVDAYQKLGEQYLRRIKDITPKEIYGFMKLLPKRGRVLDVGCAGGRDSKRFFQKGFQVVGIDLVDTFLEEARKSVPEGEVIKMDMCELNFPQNYFDGIWANAALLHLLKKNIPEVLKDFHEVLKPNGKLHIRVKRGEGAGCEKDKLSGGEERPFTYFLKDELEGLVRAARFRIIVTRIFPDESGRKEVSWISLWAEKPK
jgi:SAM-dependent methyltransferase